MPISEIGEILERGVGVEPNPSEAFAFYKKAADAGEITGYASMTRLVGRSKQAATAETLWKKYFVELAKAGGVDLGRDEPASSIYSYLFSKLARFDMPRVYPAMRRYRIELIGFMQRYLEHAFDRAARYHGRDDAMGEGKSAGALTGSNLMCELFILLHNRIAHVA